VPQELLDVGKAQYQKNCLACHGAEGKGMQALGSPDLTNDVWLYGRDLASLEDTVRKGRTGVMPPQEQLMNEYEIKLLTAYLYSFQNKSAK
jgi:cytochrome c oxidase cbb3-type subunit 3